MATVMEQGASEAVPGVAEAAAAPAAPAGIAMPWGAIGLLTCAYLVSFLDRQILSLLVEPIKADLKLSDTQLGLIQGIAFGLVFTLAGIPMGWLADRIARRKLLAVAITLWSGLTACCGFAGNATQLLIARTGVALGEAALGPSAAPLMREIVPPGRIVTALSVYSLGIPLGSGLALLLGAVILPWVTALGGIAVPGLGVLAPWQATFLIVAMPGFVVALMMLGIKEPPRQPAGTPQGAASIPEAARFFARHWRTFVGFGLPGITAMFLTFGVGFWIPAALGRTYGLGQTEVAAYLKIWGLMTVTLGTVGTLAGGVIADRMRRARDDGYILLAMLSLVLIGISFGGFLLMPSPALALLWLTPAALATALPPVAATAAAMEIIPRQMRSLLFAAWMLIVSLIGLSTGPALIGFVSDHLFGGGAGVRYAIPLCTVAGLAFAVPLLLAVRGVYHRTMTEAAQISARGLGEGVRE